MKTESIIVMRVDENNNREYRPLGLFHIFKCYDEERKDMIQEAYISIEQRKLTENVANFLAEKYNVEVIWIAENI